MTRTSLLAALLLAALVVAPGCDDDDDKAKPKPQPTPAAAAADKPGAPPITMRDATTPAPRAPVEVRVGRKQQLAFWMRPKNEGYEVRDATEKVIGRMKLSGRRVTLLTAEGDEVLVIRRQPTGLLMHGPKDKLLLAGRWRGRGHWEFQGADKKPVAELHGQRLKVGPATVTTRKQGPDIDVAGPGVERVRLRGGNLTPGAAAAFGFERLTVLERAALAVFLTEMS